LPETEIREQPGIGSRYKRYKHNIRYLNQLSARSHLYMQYQSCVRSQCQLRTISLRTVLPLNITGALGHIFGHKVSVGSECWKELSHRLRSYQQAMLPSAPSLPIHYVTDQALHLYITTFRTTGLHTVTCTHVVC
jgi:hypothetical protein